MRSTICSRTALHVVFLPVPLSPLAIEIWPILPTSLHTAAHDTPLPADLFDRLDMDDPDSSETLLANLPTSVSDSLISFGLVLDWYSAHKIVLAAVRDYVREATAPPPMWSSTRARECELCEREVPLTYHHLIPRSTHDKVRKRKWHPESMLNSVAWLCRPCHSAVHHVASNEELAKHLYTIQLLLEREDIQRWQKYAAKQRFGVKRR